MKFTCHQIKNFIIQKNQTKVTLNLIKRTIAQDSRVKDQLWSLRCGIFEQKNSNSFWFFEVKIS